MSSKNKIMGIKKLKEKYRIDHTVCRTEKGICIGSDYIHDIIVINDEGKFLKKYKNENYNDGWSTNEKLKRYQEEMLADEATGDLKKLIEEPDVYGELFPVFTIKKGKLVETSCEKYGWPNLTVEGELMYENTFFKTKAKVVKYGIGECKGWIKMLDERKQELEKEVQEKQDKKEYYESCLGELNKIKK